MEGLILYYIISQNKAYKIKLGKIQYLLIFIWFLKNLVTQLTQKGKDKIFQQSYTIQILLNFTQISFICFILTIVKWCKTINPNNLQIKKLNPFSDFISSSLSQLRIQTFKNSFKIQKVMNFTKFNFICFVLTLVN